MFNHKRLKELRNTVNVSQRELSDRCGISFHTYKAYERGVATPSVEKLCKLADYFCVSLDYLTDRSETIDNKTVYSLMYSALRRDCYELYLRRNKHDVFILDAEPTYPYNLLDVILQDYSVLSPDQEKGIEVALSKLKERERYIILSRFRDEKTLEEIGRELGVTRERIRQIEAKAIRTLKHPALRTYIELGAEKAEKEFSK